MEKNMKNQKKKKENAHTLTTEGAKRTKKAKLKRFVYIAIVVIGLAVLGWLAMLLFGNNYKTNAMKMKVNATVASRIAGVMLKDYQENWLRAETDKLAMNADGMMVSTDDIKQVIDWRKEFFQKNGCGPALEKLVADMESNYSDMGLTPAKYRDTKEIFKELLDKVKGLANLVKQPGDSIEGMANKWAAFQDDINNNIDATDFEFYLSDEDVKAKIEEVAALSSDKDLASKLFNEVRSNAAGIANMMKYQKMGFEELPNGKGVLFHVVTKGKGAKPKDDTRVRLHYEGKLMDGTVFDSSYQRGEPAVMQPKQTVPGFWHALTNMPVGSKWEIYIPYDQAYGPRGMGSHIKPYSDLFFTIETIAIEK